MPRWILTVGPRILYIHPSTQQILLNIWDVNDCFSLITTNISTTTMLKEISFCKKNMGLVFCILDRRLVEEVDKTFNLAVSEGAKVLDPVVDQFWGDRLGSIEDPFGHRWSIMTHIKDLTPEEMKKAVEGAFAKMSK
jgi:predicted lactoylglutathione lyase